MIFAFIFAIKSFKNTYLLSNNQHESSNSVLSNINTIQERYNFDDPDWKNIRIKFNYDYITGSRRDPLTCYEDGQQVKIDSETITCDKNKVVSNMDLTNFTITMNNLKTFLESFLKVIPIPNKDYDFELIIKLPQFGTSSSIANANLNIHGKTNRPLYAELDINPAKIPKFVSEFETERSDFIIKLFSECIFALGANYPKYHHKNSTMFYPDKYNYCSLTKYGKKFTFLIGPYSHLFARKHYGVDEFVGDDNTCPSGIEFTNSYLKASKFNNDISAYYYYSHNPGLNFERITDVTMAMFQDTGNYLCNWSMAQPLVLGNPESQIGGKPIKDFAFGPPQLVFPKGYLRETDSQSWTYRESDPDYTGFNFKYGEIENPPELAPSNCEGAWEEYCKGKEYYNPLNKKYVSKQSTYDYSMLRYPMSSCKNGMAMFPGHGICSKYICDKYDGFTLITPDLKDANGNQTKEETNTTSDSESDSKTNSNNKIKIIVPCVVCGVIVIAIIVIVTIIIIKKRKSNEDNDYGHNAEVANKSNKSHGQGDIEKGLASNSADNLLSD